MVAVAERGDNGGRRSQGTESGAAGIERSDFIMSVGLAMLPTKGPTDIMGNMVSSSGCRFLYPHANSAPLKVLGGLGTGELNPVSGCSSTFARSMQATQ